MNIENLIKRLFFYLTFFKLYKIQQALLSNKHLHIFRHMVLAQHHWLAKYDTRTLFACASNTPTQNVPWETQCHQIKCMRE